MNQNQPKNNKILWWIAGGIVILIIGGLVIYSVTQNKDKKNSANQKPEGNNNKPGYTSPPQTDSPVPSEEKELERYLLEKRLDLKKYFVFCLQREVKPGNVTTNAFLNGSQINANNGRSVVPSLANHLSKLIGEEKNWITFQGKYTNESSKEWNGEKLDQKIKNGEEWYIIFDKSQIDSEVCNYFSKKGGIGNVIFHTNIVLAVEAEPEVQVKKNKKDALEFLKKNDLLFINKN